MSIENLEHVIIDGQHDVIVDIPKSEVKAWNSFEESLLQEGSPETDEISLLKQKLADAEAIIAKVTALADFWAGDYQKAYCAGQMRYALGTAPKDFIHPSLQG